MISIMHMIYGRFSHSYVNGDVDLVTLLAYALSVKSILRGTSLTTALVFSEPHLFPRRLKKQATP